MNAVDVNCPHQADVSKPNTNKAKPQADDEAKDDHAINSSPLLIFGTLGGFAATFLLILVISKWCHRKRHDTRRFSVGSSSDSEADFEEIHLFGSDSDCDSAIDDDDFGVQMTSRF